MVILGSIQYSNALEITEKILQARQWKTHIQNEEMVMKYLKKYLEVHRNDEVTFWFALNRLRELPQKIKALTPKYIHPPPKDSPIILTGLGRKMEHVEMNTRNCKNYKHQLIPHDGSIYKSWRFDTLDWLVEESASNPDIWNKDKIHTWKNPRTCALCHQVVTGAFYSSYQISDHAVCPYIEISSNGFCQACSTLHSAGRSLKMPFPRYIADKLMAETNKRTQFGDESTSHLQVLFEDNILPSDLRKVLLDEMNHIAMLSQFDSDPVAEGKVIDLINPSMFPYIIGYSKSSHNDDLTLHKCAKNYEEMIIKSSHWVSKYQWLPAEVKVDKDGQCQFTSYINNLPQDLYPNLYPIFGLIFTRILPMFALCLNTSLKDQELQVIVKASDIVLNPGEVYEGDRHLDGTREEQIVATAIYYYEITNGIVDDGLAFTRQRTGYDDWPNTLESLYKWWSEMFGKCFAAYNNRGLPIGEGVRAIVLDDENILVQELMSVASIEGPLLGPIPLGRMEAKEGRCIVFSNELQYKISRIHVPTSETEAQRTRILYFFLVDPKKRIPSSSSVVPQQKEYLQQKVFDAFKDMKVGGHPLPFDICNDIAEYVAPGFALEEALLHNLKLEYERKIITAERNSEYESVNIIDY